MPLIKHSPEFLAKKAARDKVKEKAEKEVAREKLEQQTVNLYDQITKFRALNLTLKLSPEQQKEYDDLIYIFVEYNLPILDFPTLDEANFLHEILRFAKLSGEFTKDVESYRLIDSLQSKNRRNVYHLQRLNDLGISEYMKRYSLRQELRHNLAKERLQNPNKLRRK